MDEFEWVAVNNLDLDGVGDTTKLSDLKNEFYKTAETLKGKLDSRMLEEGYFDESPSAARMKYAIVAFFTGLTVLLCFADPALLRGLTIPGFFTIPGWGVIGLRIIAGLIGAVMLSSGIKERLSGAGSIIAGAVILLFAFGVNAGALIGVRNIGLVFGGAVACAAVVGAFAPAMPRKTIAGSKERAKWVAFRRYLENLSKFGDREKAQELLEKYLPYAIAFGVERDMINEFERVNVRSPHWFHTTHYTDDSYTTVDTDAAGEMPSLETVSDGLFNAVNNMSSTLVSAPSSSSSGGGVGGGAVGGGGGGGW